MKQTQTPSTLTEVALKLGVSTATVSNAFNRPDQLSRELREHILNACENWGYAGPQANARKRRVEKTGVVGVMLSNSLSYSFSDPLASRMLEGLAEVFESAGYNLLIIPSRESLKALDKIRGLVDGFIVYGPPATDRLALLKEHRRSVIAIDFYSPGITSVNIDNRYSAERIARVALGHPDRHCAVLGLRISPEKQVVKLSDTSLYPVEEHIMVQRLSGFRNAASRAQCAIPDSQIWHIPENAKHLAEQACEDALMQSRPPNVLFCMSDVIAIAACEVATRRGMTVGKDIFITGFDGIEAAANCDVPISTVAQPHREKGRVAAELFLGHINQENQCLATELIIRASCPQAL